MEHPFETLKRTLTGTTIARVLEPGAISAICKLVFTDGTAVRLFATDMGHWLDETGGTGTHKNLNSLMLDTSHYQYDNNARVHRRRPRFTVEDDRLVVTMSDKHRFEAVIADLSDWERAVCTHPKGLELLQSAALCFDNWQLVFANQNTKCPKALRLNEKV